MAKIHNFNSEFIVIDGKQYLNDVLILPDGCVKEREPGKGRISSHKITVKEIENLHHMHADVAIIGTGVVGNAKLADDTMGYLDSFNFNPIKLSTSLAIEKFNLEASIGKRVAVLIHITC
jgi:hypothetical protein